MKNVLRLMIIILLSINILFAKPISKNEAFQLAINFFNIQKSNQQRMVSLSYTYLPNLERTKSINEPKNSYFYIFNYAENSFVIISGDDIFYPILGYSNESKFDINNISPATKEWLDQYAEQIWIALENHHESTEEIQNEWKRIRNKQIQINKIQSGVSPLLKTKWNQSPYYNDLCPWDEELKARTITGCVATAMAQIMRYWSYPAMGSGSHGYTHPKYGYLFANFGVTYYDWSEMPEVVKEPNLAVATINYHCGVSVNMGYGVHGSGAAGSVVVAPALINYFRYDKSLRIEDRNSYSFSQWITMLKEELLSGRPIYYQGAGNVGGHAFVCDGFDNNNFFHFNWGWGGASDGYFKIDALNPGSMTFNASQSVVIGIQPPIDQIENTLELASEIQISSKQIYYGANFNVNVQIRNTINDKFRGDLTAAVLDTNNNLIDYIEILKDTDLEANLIKNYTFNSKGLIGMVPGKYKIFIFQREPEGQWKIVPKSPKLARHYAEIEVLDNTEFTLNSRISVLPNNIINNGEKIVVHFDVKNYTNNIFKGKIFVGLFNYNRSNFIGSIGEYIETNGLKPLENYSNGITIQTKELNLTGGSYYLAVFYQEEDSDNYRLIGSKNDFRNPIKIVIKSLPLEPDKYEMNNFVSNSTKLSYEFINDKSVIEINDANIHDTTDIDIYQIILSPNYNYHIDISINDANSKNPLQNSTVDIVFQYSFDGLNWSELFDNYLPQAIRTFGYKTLYIKIKPFFTEQTGIYQLYLFIKRNQDSIAILNLQGDLNFGKVILGTSESRTISIKNSGSIDLKVEYISIPPECKLDWESGSIPPDSTILITVTFTPEEEDEYFGYLVIKSNGVGPKMIEYYGIGWVPEHHNAIIQLEGDLNFGEVLKGSIETKPLKIMNTGTSILKVYSISLPLGFVSNWESGEIAPNESKVIEISFIPTQAKIYSGNLVINCNFNSGINNMPIFGKGINPSSVNYNSKENILLQPNPAIDLVTILLPQNELIDNVTIIDLIGNIKIYQTNSSTIDITSLHSGIYLIKIKTRNGQNFIEKFIKL